MSRLTTGHLNEGTQVSWSLFSATFPGVEVKEVWATKELTLDTSVFWLLGWVMHSVLLLHKSLPIMHLIFIIYIPSYTNT